MSFEHLLIPISVDSLGGLSFLEACLKIFIYHSKPFHYFSLAERKISDGQHLLIRKFMFSFGVLFI